MIYFKFLLVIIVIYSNLSLYSTSCVHQTVNGSLEDVWQINFTIFAEEFKGMILYFIDSGNNQIGVEVTKGLGDERNIAIKFNKKSKVAHLLNLCGCTPCNDRKITFNVSAKDGLLKVVCNNHHSESLSIYLHSKNEGTVEGLDKAYPIPMDITNGSGSIYLMIGNVGPYLTNDNITINIPMREQMIGCVDALYYNDKLITLISEGNKVRPSCSMKCMSSPCNGGLCRQISQDNFTCDCSKTALNGRYCNKDLKMYNRGDNNSYNQSKEATQIYLKMTWKQLLERRYCLMEIIGSGTSYFLLNSSFLPNINIGVANFVTVNIANGDLSIKMKSHESRIAFLSYGNTRINVGFSERNGSCVAFQGAYDLHYDSSELRQIETTVTSGATVPNNSKEQNNMSLLTLPWIGGITVGSLVIFVIIVIVLYLRNRKEMKSHIQQLTALSTYSLDKTSRVFTETYGKVDDSLMYDYIQDGDDVYATINQ